MAGVSIRTKTLSGIGAILAVLCGLSIVSWLALVDLRARIDDLNRNRLQGTVALANAQDVLWNLRYNVPQIFAVSKQEDRQKIADDEAKLRQQFEQHLERYRALDLTPEEHAALAS